MPKELTPEEIERLQNLEQDQEIQPPSPAEEDTSVRMDEINDSVAHKEEIVSNTQNDIEAIRNEIGLPPSDEVPPSIKIEQGAIEKLNSEKSQIEARIKQIESGAKNMTTNDGEKFSTITDSKDIQEYKNLKKQLENIDNNKTSSERSTDSEETKKFEQNFKTLLEDTSVSSKRVLIALNERYDQNLTPILSRDNFLAMDSTLKTFNESAEKGINVDSLTKATENVKTLYNIFDTFKIQGTSVNENPQNLEKLIDTTKRFTNTLSEGYRKLPIEMADKQIEEKSKELRVALQKLSEQSQKLESFVGALRENRK